MILIEEAWKAIAKEGMAEYIKYLFKTVRKYFGEAILVTQEVDDIIASEVVKESIIFKVYTFLKCSFFNRTANRTTFVFIHYHIHLILNKELKIG